MKYLPPLKTLLFSLSTLALITLDNCIPNPSPPRPVICKSGADCGKLRKRNDSQCNRQFSNLQYYIYNDHPSKNVTFLIEQYKTDMDQGWPAADDQFIRSDMLTLKPKVLYPLGCEQDIVYDENLWRKNTWKLVKACFTDDADCPAIAAPVTKPPSPISCDDECKDDGQYCLKSDLCEVQDASWLQSELAQVSKTLKNANLANSTIDLSKVAPMLLVQLCKRDKIEIKNRVLSMPGETCEIEVPRFSHPEFDKLWIWMPSNFVGRIDTHYDVLLDFTVDDFSSPKLFMTKKDSSGTVIMQEELIERMYFSEREIWGEGRNGYCFSLNLCNY